MRNIWTIARREYKHFFLSPIAYVFLFLTLILLGLFFYLDILYSVNTGQYVPGIERTIQLLIFPLLFLGVPILTMRSISDENRSGTLELLLTAPVRDWELITGKWLGGFLFFLTCAAITWVYPLILNNLTEPGIDQGILLTSYLGLILIISTMCSMGVFASSIFSNPIASLFGSIGLLVIFWIIGSPAQLSQGRLAQILGYLSLPDHFYSTFMVGVIKLEDIMFYISMTIFMLFLGTMSIESRRWR
jgi:ABC-2 type transport system permease protein